MSYEVAFQHFFTNLITFSYILSATSSSIRTFLNIFQIWLTFVAVAYRAIVYYNTTLDVINWLSLVFNLSGILMGAVATYVLERFGLKFALVLSAWLTCIGACIRIVR